MKQFFAAAKNGTISQPGDCSQKIKKNLFVRIVHITRCYTSAPVFFIFSGEAISRM
jgi:hypothetical protein